MAGFLRRRSGGDLRKAVRRKALKTLVVLLLLGIGGWWAGQHLGFVLALENKEYRSETFHKLLVGWVVGVGPEDGGGGGSGVVVFQFPVEPLGVYVGEGASGNKIESAFVSEEVIESQRGAHSAVEEFLGREIRGMEIRRSWLERGASAGLAMALFMLEVEGGPFVEEGLRVAVTGTVAEDGTVGKVGSIEAKARAAADAGMDVLVLPRTQAQRARNALDEGSTLVVMGVGTLYETVSKLCAISPGRAGAEVCQRRAEVGAGRLAEAAERHRREAAAEDLTGWAPERKVGTEAGAEVRGAGRSGLKNQESSRGEEWKREEEAARDWVGGGVESRAIEAAPEIFSRREGKRDHESENGGESGGPPRGPESWSEPASGSGSEIGVDRWEAAPGVVGTGAMAAPLAGLAVTGELIAE